MWHFPRLDIRRRGVGRDAPEVMGRLAVLRRIGLSWLLLEYVEPGISGGSVLKRVAFQQLLEDLKTKRDIDLVIVWNISRWARNEEDLWVAYGLIQRYGAELVSVTEPIDSSPSGLLMLGVLAAVAAHDRRKLSIEVSRGRKQKAEVGGTPGRAPIGYSNVRTIIDGHEVRDVALDPERAPLVQVAFELYATGNYSLRGSNGMRVLGSCGEVRGYGQASC